MSKTIVCEIRDRNALFTLLEHYTGLIIIKFGAEWCNPCKLIKKDVNQFFISSPAEVICCDIDIDNCFDVYSFLKSKKMVNGIPAILCWKKGNATFIPDDSVSGSDPNELHRFFVRCGNMM